LYRILITLLLIILVAPAASTTAMAGARTPTPTPHPDILFGETEITYDESEGYKFHISITTPGVIPVKGRFSLYYQKVHQVVGTLRIDPEHPTELAYYVDKSSMFIFPFVPFHVQWDITDDQGRTGSSGEQILTGEDPRYSWKTLESDQRELSVHYHDRSISFGQTVLEAAEQSAEVMEDDFNLHLARPIRVIVYNSQDEVLGYLDSFDENTGGQAFAHLGVTIQVIEQNLRMQSWIEEVIPHEISHLYFFQATGGVDSSWEYTAPSWLNEGLAEISENGMEPDYLDNINWELGSSDYLPSLTYLDYNFNDDAERAEIDYMMAYSITSYLINTYGYESITAILEEYANGAATEEAFLTVLGRNFTTLSYEWREASGLPVDANNMVMTTPTKTPDPSPTATPLPQSRDRTEVIIGVAGGLAFLAMCVFILMLMVILLLIMLNARGKTIQAASRDPGSTDLKRPGG
jgi:hypothetical protein